MAGATLFVSCFSGGGNPGIKSTGNDQSPDVNEMILSARNLRDILWKDPHRPRYHLMPW